MPPRRRARRAGRAGRGERIEISLYDVALSALVNVSGSALVTGEEPGRHGNAHPSIVPYETFAAADGPITVAGANDGLYRRLCEAIERPDLAEDERYGTNPGGSSTAKSSWASSTASSPRATADEWVERLDAGRGSGRARCAACSRRSSTRRTLSVDHPTIGTLPLVASPLGPRAEPGRRRCSASTPARCSRELGYDDEEIEALLLPSSA